MNSRQRRLCRRRATRTVEGLRRLADAAFGTGAAIQRFGDAVRRAGGTFATLRTGFHTDDFAGRYLAQLKRDRLIYGDCYEEARSDGTRTRIDPAQVTSIIPEGLTIVDDPSPKGRGR